jgi:hypothetical protein
VGFCLAAQKTSAINAASAKTATITVNMIPVIVPSNWVGGVYMVDVGVGVGVMPAPHGNPVNLSLLNRGRQEEDMNRTVVTPGTEAARNYPTSWLALTALSTVGNRADHRIGSSLGGSGGRCSFQQPGNHGGDHLNVTHFLGRDSHDQVFALADIRQFQPWNRYRMAKVISPQAPPSSLCTRTPDRAYRLGLELQAAVWTNMGSSSM